MARGGNARTDRRKAARSYGIVAEAIALMWLLARGYRILARHYLAPGGEIDIVAAKGATVAFIEVKARGDLDVAATSITAQKQARICRAAGFWLSRNRAAASANLRCDAIFIAPWRWPRHEIAAFPLEI